MRALWEAPADAEPTYAGFLRGVHPAYGQLGGCPWSGCAAPLNGQWYWRGDEATLAQARHNIAQAISAIQAVLTHFTYLPLVKR